MWLAGSAGEAEPIDRSERYRHGWSRRRYSSRRWRRARCRWRLAEWSSLAGALGEQRSGAPARDAAPAGLLGAGLSRRPLACRDCVARWRPGSRGRDARAGKRRCRRRWRRRPWIRRRAAVLRSGPRRSTRFQSPPGPRLQDRRRPLHAAAGRIAGGSARPTPNGPRRLAPRAHHGSRPRARPRNHSGSAETPRHLRTRLGVRRGRAPRAGQASPGGGEPRWSAGEPLALLPRYVGLPSPRWRPFPAVSSSTALMPS